MKKIDKKQLHEIFDGLKNKNETAYNLFYKDYYSLVYGIIFSIMKNQTDSEDIAQEVFTKIYKLDESKLPSNNEASWLFTVCKNECFQYLRRKRPNISLEEIYDVSVESSDINEIIDKEYFSKLMDGLKDDEKMIVSLKVLSDFTFKKISQIMDIPIGTVQWKYYKAINSLKVSIGSLLGAALAFIMVLANGDFWKSRQYVDEKSEVEGNKKTVEDTENESTNFIINNEDDNVVNNSETVQKDDSVSTVVIDEESNNTTVSTNRSVFQFAFLTVGIVLLLISIIFFKIYQQKFKKKSSK